VVFVFNQAIGQIPPSAGEGVIAFLPGPWCDFFCLGEAKSGLNRITF
jgi:hypothetical protein